MLRFSRETNKRDGGRDTTWGSIAVAVALADKRFDPLLSRTIIGMRNCGKPAGYRPCELLLSPLAGAALLCKI